MDRGLKSIVLVANPLDHEAKEESYWQEFLSMRGIQGEVQGVIPVDPKSHDRQQYTIVYKGDCCQSED